MSTALIPRWLHIVYGVGDAFTCGVLWVAWIVHWGILQSRMRKAAQLDLAQEPQTPGKRLPGQHAHPHRY